MSLSCVVYVGVTCTLYTHIHAMRWHCTLAFQCTCNTKHLHGPFSTNLALGSLLQPQWTLSALAWTTPGHRVVYCRKWRHENQWMKNTSWDFIGLVTRYPCQQEYMYVTTAQYECRIGVRFTMGSQLCTNTSLTGQTLSACRGGLARETIQTLAHKDGLFTHLSVCASPSCIAHFPIGIVPTSIKTRQDKKVYEDSSAYSDTF